jgi:hypothetical protein
VVFEVEYGLLVLVHISINEIVSINAFGAAGVEFKLGRWSVPCPAPSLAQEYCNAYNLGIDRPAPEPEKGQRTRFGRGLNA